MIKRVFGNTFEPLAVPAFLALWIGTILSNIGTMIQSVGAAWLMTTLTTSPAMVALVQTASTLPFMLLSLPVGAAADLYDRRIIMICAQSVVVAAATVCAVLAFVNGLTPWTLLALTFVVGAGAVLHAPTWQASFGDIVPRTMLPSAVALNSLSYNTARSIGPALGGAVAAILGASATFLLNALATLPLLIILLRWKGAPRNTDVPTEPLLNAVWIGIRHAGSSRPILNAMAHGAGMAFSGGAMWALLPLIAKEQLQGGPGLFGVLLGAIGVGALTGASFSGAVRQRLRSDQLWTGSALTLAIASIVMGLSTNVWLTAAALIVAGAAWLLGLSTLISLVQLSAPRWVAGRVLSMYQLTTFGSLAVGSAAWGALADHLALSVTLCIAGLAALMAALFFRLNPLPDIPPQ